MTDNSLGKIGWVDLTVNDASGLGDFYSAVAGWKPDPVKMGGYHDYNMNSADGEPVAGVCHARGSNAGIPPQWMIYVTVADIQASMRAATEKGGEVIHQIKNDAGSTTMAYVRDPAGAAFGLYQA